VRLNRLYWRPWDQEQAIANARAASVELSRARVDREAVDLYLARLVKSQGGSERLSRLGAVPQAAMPIASA
jgi:hypothetical protein